MEFKWKIPLVAILVIIFHTAQLILIPLTEASFGGSFGIYSFLFINCLLFNFYFLPLCAWEYHKKIINLSMLKFLKEKWWQYILVGLCNALNGILLCYSVILTRTSGVIQNILMQTNIPFTLIISIGFFRRGYSKMNLLGCLIVISGVILGMIPTFLGKTSSNSVFWCLMLIASMFFGSLMNILLDWLSKKYKTIEKEDFSANLAQGVEIFFQFIFVVLLFWLDLIPHFGSSENIEQWANQLKNGWECFLIPGSRGDKTNYTLILCLVFVIAYCGSYYWMLKLMEISNANLVALVGTLSPALGIIFWISFPFINEWAGGSPYSLLDLIFSLSSIPFLIIGSIIYKKGEKEINNINPIPLKTTKLTASQISSSQLFEVAF